MTYLATIAANRFGLGARPGEIAAAQTDPRGWLLRQIGKPPLDPNQPGAAAALAQLALFRQAKQAIKKDGNKPDTPPRRPLARSFAAQVGNTLESAIGSGDSLAWRLREFFSNHFSVSSRGAALLALAPTLEHEAIAPHVFGKFEDMLLAVSSHPAMLVYLNNERSFGPDSMIGRRNRQRGLNENLAREILELHTLGVNGGYDQQDVIELALAISGWSITRPREPEPRGFVFRTQGHQPGARRVLGKTYAEAGLAQGKAVLTDLARHPATARFLSRKLAQHFVSDKPAPALVEQMTRRWQASGGDLGAVITELINHPAAWEPEPQKFKTPREFLISACRATGAAGWQARELIGALELLGQRPFNAGSPAGYGDSESAWDGADALLARIDWAARFSGRLGLDAERLAHNSLGAALTPATRTAIERAESRTQGIALLLMSPEFQRR
ncbi:DUF1800 domain-containing protein [Exilibacterium tricleocarpae]|uniref:DUF1800 domain-containing protein n=1 Tax=Exilibacterium tricleocarpae TaxID=2591008 RepID=A0A545ST69_9GAMM|nr:DUF1800 domain-containing protein [Exilibacterium tricleocarpae]TQV68163.1 DUF1800 domain-containing protein [Exilibacterium tricleocarpae]